MAPLIPTQRSTVHALVKRELPHTKFIAIAVSVGVFLVIVISIALWLYIRGWKLPQLFRFDQKRLDSHNQSAPPTRHGTNKSGRASTYWSADDIGKMPEPQATEVSWLDSRDSRIVMLPTPSPFSFERHSRVVKLPLPSLLSWRSSIDEKAKPQRPSSNHVRTGSRHISTQIVDTTKPAPNPTPDHTPILDDFPQPGGGFGRWS